MENLYQSLYKEKGKIRKPGKKRFPMHICDSLSARGSLGYQLVFKWLSKELRRESNKKFHGTIRPFYFKKILITPKYIVGVGKVVILIFFITYLL